MQCFVVRDDNEECLEGLPVYIFLSCHVGHFQETTLPQNPVKNNNINKNIIIYLNNINITSIILFLLESVGILGNSFIL